MKHNLTISVSKQPRADGVIACRTVTMRERFLRLLFGVPCKMTILVPEIRLRKSLFERFRWEVFSSEAL